jgi:uncharacterized protein (DUF608 family)
MTMFTCRVGVCVQAGVWLLGLGLLAGAGPADDHRIPEDKGLTRQQRSVLLERGEQRVYTGAARATIGMPCGGIAAGQVYVLGDGTLGCFQIDGRTYFSGVGHDCYRTYRPARPLRQGFAIRVDGGVWTATLDERGFDAIAFVGEYPRALVRYLDGVPVAPVAVELEVFSPFVPLDARNSAWPATVLSFSVTNTTDRAVEVELAGWLENGVFGAHPRPLTFERRNRVMRGGGVTSVFMDAVELERPDPGEPVTRVIADFELGTYGGWEVTGAAFGDAPAAGTHAGQQAVSEFSGRWLVNSFTEGDGPTGRMVSESFVLDQPYVTFRIGGGAHAGRTCLNLVVDGEVVRSSAGRNDERLALRAWDVGEYAGESARLEIVDEHGGAWGHISVDDIALTNVLPEEVREYSTAALDYGSMALSVVGEGEALPGFDPDRWATVTGSTSGSGEAHPAVGRRLVGGVRTAFRLEPGAVREAVFVVSWYFPNLHTKHGRMYTNWFEDAGDVARKLASDLPRLHEATRHFCDTYYRGTTLPWWLATRLMMPVSTLATGTVQWWNNGRFWAWEGVCCCGGTCTHVWNYAQAHAWLFPELARSARTMQDLGEGFEETSGLVGFRSNRAFAADGQAGTILKCYREHVASADPHFLNRYWPMIKLALEYLVSHDLDEDGLIENDRQHNTYDINFSGPNTFVGGLYLAALRAGEEMAREVRDDVAAERYRKIFDRGRKWSASYLFNGEYFVQKLPAGRPGAWQYGAGCLSDQLFGQTWAHLLGLGHLYPDEQVRTALKAVYRHNWAPDVGPQNERYPPERWFARPGEPGLFLCTWPRGGRPARPVRYRDEIWTGIEYQVAAGLIWEGFVKRGLSVVRGIEERYDGVKHNPWNEVECGDHYARALASWHVLHALAGLEIHGPAGRLGFAPRLQQDDFRCFFCGGGGWGTLSQTRDAEGQTNRIEMAGGSLRLSELAFEVPVGTTVAGIEVRCDSGLRASLAGMRAAGVEQEGRRCTVRLANPEALQPGDALIVELSW